MERLELFSKVCECGNIGSIHRIGFLIDKCFQCSYCEKKYSHEELKYIEEKKPTEDNIKEIQEILKNEFGLDVKK